MSVSVEALAMAGADYHESGIDVEEWEREDIELEPPPHLLANEEEKEEYLSVASHFSEDNDTVGAVENSSCEESKTDLEAKLACHLSYYNLQPADMEDESDLLRWQNSYDEEYQHMSMEKLNLLEA
ncbi:hypothetical protein CICLE_v10027310mg [Citrus x clementina]|uniref:Uncharacterized protein n=1 Tax=Citrus clementina TaxID=85681 RepID=V4SLB0_CITCL|nr:uncharacterized protein LOC127898906 [Citrus sinensis]ESR41452.1 hypothetical protein CICLE_v10027310mg [Citrus x clementina]